MAFGPKPSDMPGWHRQRVHLHGNAMEPWARIVKGVGASRLQVVDAEQGHCTDEDGGGEAGTGHVKASRP